MSIRRRITSIATTPEAWRGTAHTVLTVSTRRSLSAGARLLATAVSTAGRAAVGSGVGALVRRRDPPGLPEAIAAAAAALAPGTGTVVVSPEASVALHRAHDGVVTTLDARCPHRGEAVVFNVETCQWDCLRHGAVFAADGTLVDGKGLADRPLEPYRLDA